MTAVLWEDKLVGGVERRRGARSGRRFVEATTR